MAREFTKHLVGRFSAKNKCFALDGEVLYVAPRSNVPMKPAVGHRFTSAVNKMVTSKFGWVQNTEPFTVDDFIRKYFNGEIDSAGESHLITMFRDIQAIEPGKPVGVDYFKRGLDQPRMELNVHRVIFYGRVADREPSPES
ncbi:MAG TPA: hypothetical protein VH740_25625 [Vicinamibacterales bacterium]|jgi:hypothetical protein